jgi:lysophospholipase L1-like esterase
MSNSCVIPLPKIEDDFYDCYARHEAKCAAANSGNHDLIFIGDSITHFFEGHQGFTGKGDEIWRKFYGRRNALNLGFGWDRTQNVLYRLANGEFKGQTPKLVVLCIGTNNLTGTANAAENTADEICAGILAICDEILRRSPSSHILVQALFPRDKAGSPLRLKRDSLNSMLAKIIQQRPNCEFTDFGSLYLDAKGEIPPSLMPDLVHPATEGYRLWAEAIEPVVQRWLQP